MNKLLAPLFLGLSIVVAACPASAADSLRIVSATPGKDQSLVIAYSDGGKEVISKDQRGSEQDDEPINQDEVFSQVQVSGDGQRVGWLPQYMVCSQSWPCTPELVLYRHGGKPASIAAGFGILWHWMFLQEGKQVVIHYGFPHGDADGEYALYDADSLRSLATFSPREDKGVAPEWVKSLRAREE